MHGSSSSYYDEDWSADSQPTQPLVQTSAWQHVASVADRSEEGTINKERWDARHLSRVDSGIRKALHDGVSEHQRVLEEISLLREELGLPHNANAKG